MSAQNWLTVKNRLSENLVWSKFRSDLSFLIIIWRLTFKNDAFSLNSTEFTRWAYPSNCIWFTCDHDRYVWLNQIKNSLYLAWIPGKFVIFFWKTLPVIEMDMSVFQKFFEAKSFLPFCYYLDSRWTFWLLPRTQGTPDCNLFCPWNHFIICFQKYVLPWGRSEVLHKVLGYFFRHRSS